MTSHISPLYPVIAVITAPFRATLYIIKLIWQRISAIATAIFAHFPSFRTQVTAFTQRQMSLLHLTRPPKNSETEHPSLQNYKITTIHRTQHAVAPPARTTTDPAYHLFDPPLEELRTFMRDIFQLLFDGIFDHLMANGVTKAQNNAPSIPPAIRPFTALFADKTKLDHLNHLLEIAFQEDMNIVIKEMMRISGSRIADFFSEKLAKHIDNFNFPEFFDTAFTDTVNKQVQAIAVADRYRADHKRLITDASAIAEIVPTTREQIDQRAKAMIHMSQVEQQGGEAIFLENKMLEKFAHQPICGPIIVKIIEQQLAERAKGNDPSHTIKINEELIYEELTDKLLKILAPIQKLIREDGTIEEVDAFSEIWNRLYFPIELEVVKVYFVELFSDIITPDTAPLFDNAKDSLMQIIKSLFNAKAREITRKHLLEVVRSGFEAACDKNKLDLHVADSILPSTVSLLIRYTIRREIAWRLKEYTPLFLEMVRTGVPNEQFINQLIADVKQRYSHFDTTQFSEEKWVHLAKATLDCCNQSIFEATVNGEEVNPETVQEIEIEAILNTFLSQAAGKNDPIHGEIVKHLVFGLGEVQYQWLYSLFVEGTVSGMITDSLETMRVSHDFLISVTVDMLKSAFLSPRWVESLFLETPRHEISPEETRVKLLKQIAMTSNVVYDIFISGTEKSSTLKKYAVKQTLSGTPDRVIKLATVIYDKLFCEKSINLNLLTRVSDLFAKNL